MAGRNIEKKASIDSQLRQLVPAKVSENDKLIEYDALLLDRFLLSMKATMSLRSLRNLGKSLLVWTSTAE